MAQRIEFDFSFGMLDNSPSLHKNLSELTDPKYLPRNQLKAEVFNEYERLFSEISTIIGEITSNDSIGLQLDDLQAQISQISTTTGSTPPIASAMISRGGILPTIDRKTKITETDAYRQVQQEFAFDNTSATSDATAITVYGGATFIKEIPAFMYDPAYLTFAPAEAIEVTDDIPQITQGTTYTINLKNKYLKKQGVTSGSNYTIIITDNSNTLTEYDQGVLVDLENGIVYIDGTNSVDVGGSNQATISYAYYQARTDGIYLRYNSGQYVADVKNPLVTYGNGEKGLYEVYISPKQSPEQSTDIATAGHIINYDFNEVLQDWQIVKVINSGTEAEEIFKIEDNKVLQLAYRGIDLSGDVLALKPGLAVINGRQYNFPSTTITLDQPDGIVTIYLNEYNEIQSSLAYNTITNIPNTISLFGIKTHTANQSTLDDIIPLYSTSNNNEILFKDGLDIDGVFGTDTSGVIGWDDNTNIDPFLSINNEQIMINDIIINTAQPKYVSDMFENNKTYEINFDNKTLEYKIDEYNGDRDTFNKNSIIRLTRSNFDNNSTINTIAVESIPNIITKKSSPYKTSIISFKYTNQPQTITFEHNIKGNYLAAVNLFYPEASHQIVDENEVSVACDPNKLTIGITPVTSATITGTNYQRILANITLIEITNDMTTDVTKINEPLQNVTNIFGMPLYAQDYMYYKHLNFNRNMNSFDTYDTANTFGSIDDYYIKYVIIPDYLIQQSYSGPVAVNTPNYKWPIFLPIIEQVESTSNPETITYSKTLFFKDYQFIKNMNKSRLYIGSF